MTRHQWRSEGVTITHAVVAVPDPVRQATIVEDTWQLLVRQVSWRVAVAKFTATVLTCPVVSH